MARGLKVLISESEGLYYLCRENKGADLRLCFHICKKADFSLRGSSSERIALFLYDSNETRKQKTVSLKMLYKNSDDSCCFVLLLLNIPVNSYGHVKMVTPHFTDLLPNIEMTDTPYPAIKHSSSKRLQCICRGSPTYHLSWAGSGTLSSYSVLSLQICVKVLCSPTIS